MLRHEEDASVVRDVQDVVLIKSRNSPEDISTAGISAQLKSEIDIPQEAHLFLEKFYSLHNPEKLSSINTILVRYKGIEENLITNLMEKYNMVAEDLDTMLPGNHLVAWMSAVKVQKAAQQQQRKSQEAKASKTSKNKGQDKNKGKEKDKDKDTDKSDYDEDDLPPPPPSFAPPSAAAAASVLASIISSPSDVVQTPSEEPEIEHPIGKSVSTPTATTPSTTPPLSSPMVSPSSIITSKLTDVGERGRYSVLSSEAVAISESGSLSSQLNNYSSPTKSSSSSPKWTGTISPSSRDPALQDYWRTVSAAETPSGTVNPSNLVRSATKIIERLEEENDELQMTKWELTQRIKEFTAAETENHLKYSTTVAVLDAAILSDEFAEYDEQKRNELQDMRDTNRFLKEKLASSKHGNESLLRDVSTLHTRHVQCQAELLETKTLLEETSAELSQMRTTPRKEEMYLRQKLQESEEQNKELQANLSAVRKQCIAIQAKRLEEYNIYEADIQSMKLNKSLAEIQDTLASKEQLHQQALLSQQLEHKGMLDALEADNVSLKSSASRDQKAAQQLIGNLKSQLRETQSQLDHVQEHADSTQTALTEATSELQKNGVDMEQKLEAKHRELKQTLVELQAALDVAETSRTSHEENVTQQQQALQAALAQIKANEADHSSMQTSLQEELAEKHSQLEQALKKLEEEKVAEAALDSSMAEQLRSKNDELEKVLLRLQGAEQAKACVTAELASLRDAHDKHLVQLSEARSNTDREKAALLSAHGRHQDELSEQRDSLEREYGVRIREWEEKHTKLCDSHQTEIARMQLEVDERHRKWEEKHLKLHDAHQSKLQEHESEIARLLCEADTRVQEWKDKYRQDTRNALEAHEAEVSQLKDESDARIREWEQKHDILDGTHNAMLQAHQVEVARLKRESTLRIREWEKKHDGIHNTNKDLQARILTVEQNEHTLSAQLEQALQLQIQQGEQIRYLSARSYNRFVKMNVASDAAQSEKDSCDADEALAADFDDMYEESGVEVELLQEKDEFADERRRLFPDTGELPASLLAKVANIAAVDHFAGEQHIAVSVLTSAVDVIWASFVASRVELKYAQEEAARAVARTVEQQLEIDSLYDSAEERLHKQLHQQLISTTASLQMCKSHVSMLEQNLKDSKLETAILREKCETAEAEKADMLSVIRAQMESRRKEFMLDMQNMAAEYARDKNEFELRVAEERRLEIDLRKLHRQLQLQETRRLREELIKAVRLQQQSEADISFLQTQLLQAADYIDELTNKIIRS